MNRLTKWALLSIGIIAMVIGAIFFFQKDDHFTSSFLMVIGFSLIVISFIKE